MRMDTIQLLETGLTINYKCFLTLLLVLYHIKWELHILKDWIKKEILQLIKIEFLKTLKEKINSG